MSLGLPHRLSGVGGSASERRGGLPLPAGHALTEADWHAVLALVGEVGELGTSPTEACGHLME